MAKIESCFFREPDNLEEAMAEMDEVNEKHLQKKPHKRYQTEKKLN